MDLGIELMSELWSRARPHNFESLELQFTILITLHYILKTICAVRASSERALIDWILVECGCWLE